MYDYLKETLQLQVVKNYIEKIVGMGNSHAYLFSGRDSFTLDKITDIFLASIMCFNSDILPCLECKGCARAVSKRGLDIYEFPKVADKSVLTKDVEEILDSANKRTIESDYKIYILNNSENLSKIVQNKLLKTVEEPADNTIFIFKSLNQDKLLPTLRSRCRMLSIPELSNDDIYNIFCNNFTDSKLNIAIGNAKGNPGKVLDMLDDPLYNEIYNDLIGILVNMQKPVDITRFTAKLRDNKKFFLEYLKMATQLLSRALLHDKGANSGLGSRDVDKNIKLISNAFSIKSLVKLINLCEEYIAMLDDGVNRGYMFENFLLKIVKEKVNVKNNSRDSI